MEKQPLTPEESLNLISRTIQESKNAYRENGAIYILMGIVFSAAGLGQFLLLINQYYNINYYPYFIMPVFGIYVFFHFKSQRQKQKVTKTILGKVLSGMGILMGINFIVLGFFFYRNLQTALFPVFFILLAIYLVIIGISMRFWLFIISGVFLNLLAFITFTISQLFHPLIFSIAMLLTFVIPGILLKIKISKEYV